MLFRSSKLLEKIKPAYEKREELNRKAEELTRLLQLKALEATIALEEARLNKGTLVWNETAQQLKKLKTEKQQLGGIIKETRSRIPDLALLSTIRAWYIEKHILDKQLLENEKDIAGLVQQEKETQGQIADILTAPVFENLPEDAGFNVCVQYLKAQSEKIKEKQKLLSEQESHFLVKAKLKDYAEAMEDGKPCPLCGSLSHPEVFKSEDISEELDRIRVDQKLLEQHLENIAGLGNQLSLLDNQQQLIRRNQNELDEKKKVQQQKNNVHTGHFIWEKYRDEEKLNSAFVEAAQIQEKLKEQEAALDEFTKKLEQEEQNKERFRIELEKIKTLLTVHQTELKTIGQQLQMIQPEQYRQVPVALIEEEKNNLLKEHVRIEKVFTENSNLLLERTKLKDMLAGSLSVNRRELEQEQLSVGKLKKELDEQLGKSTFQSIDAVAQILSELFDAEAEKQKLVWFRDQLLRTKSLLEQLQHEIGERGYDAEAHKNLTEEIVLLKAQITQKNQEQGKTAELLKKLRKDLESQVLLRSELEKLDVRAENLKTMKSLFKASGFVNYISSVYLQNLCNAANDRFFQLTRQKLSLEITPDNNFQVRDFMNGGKVRSVKTLSGGQTFQAALSLALALADNIQKITESNQNFFFLDEGFGSLDKESLTVVFDTLKSLRKENRIVGVISHVEEMQQEIDVHLRIENHEEKGSLIYANWME